MPRDPSTPFDFDALDTDAEPAREPREWEGARLTLELVTDFLFAGRLAPLELLARLAALGIARGHHKFTGKSGRDIARQFGISQSAVNRAKRRAVPELRRLAGIAKMGSDSPARRQKRIK